MENVNRLSFHLLWNPFHFLAELNPEVEFGTGFEVDYDGH